MFHTGVIIMFNHDDIIYMAGIIDGEGSICIEIQSPCKSRKVTYYSPRLVVINTNVPLMNWINEKFGGTVRQRKHVENCKLCYKWNIFSFNAANLLKECLPFMIVKKRHAEIIIEFMGLDKKGWNVPKDVQIRREELYLELKKINKTY
jgi:hypothetical protein